MVSSTDSVVRDSHTTLFAARDPHVVLGGDALDELHVLGRFP
jgi:hypothetical protein